MPMKRELYPVDWEAIATAVKGAADWTCQQCGRQCRRPDELFDSHVRTLTVAHLYPADHAPDAPVVCVAALCAPCHLRLDAPRKARQRIERRWHQLALRPCDTMVQHPPAAMVQHPPAAMEVSA